MEEFEKIEAYRIDHLPIVKAYAEKIGLVEIINQLVSSEMEVEAGTIALGLLFDTLSGRSPLYRLEEYFENEDTELLFGESVTAEDFNDDNVGRVLDKLYEVGTIKIFSELAKRAFFTFGIDNNKVKKVHVHHDTTSVSVWGDYILDPDKKEILEIKNGHSKDYRPDLKQFLISMLCVDRNVPIFGKSESGNTSDKTVNNTVLTTISQKMAQIGLGKGAYVYVADSAMVTEDNLKLVGDDIFVISRLPATYSECSRAITEAVKQNNWKEIGILSQSKPTRNRPVASYKLYETEVKLYEKTYRAVVVHSSSHDQRRQKRIDKELLKDRQELEEKIKGVEKFFCRADAEDAARRFREIGSEYYQLDVAVEESPIYQRGRPSKEGIKKIKTMKYGLNIQIKEKIEVISVKREEAGCFVLISNIPNKGEETYDSESILKAYKEQNGIEQNFEFLKDPLIVNDLFLKKPERIEALGLVLLIALLIWRLMERSLRAYTESEERNLLGWDKKPTNRPTSFMMVTKFTGVTIIKVGDKRRLQKPLSEAQKRYLCALGVDVERFTNPRYG